MKLIFSNSESKYSSRIKERSHKENYKYSSESSDSNSGLRKRKYKPSEEISGEFKKIKPHMFNGEVEKGEEVEAWLSGMKNYFHIYNYFDRLKSWMVVCNLTEKDDIWWQDIKRVKNVKEQYLIWRVFKKYFKRKFLSEHYYEERDKEFYELKKRLNVNERVKVVNF